MDSLLIMLAILAITAISSWLQRKGQREDPGSLGDEWKTIKPRKTEPPPQPAPPKIGQPTSSPRKAPPAIDWERELRRLLQGDAPTAAPPPPPPLVREEPAPAPRPAPPPVVRPVKPPPMRFPVPAVVERRESGPASTILVEASSAYQKAQQLHKSVADRLREVDQAIELHKAGAPAHTRAVPPDVRSALSMLQNPKTVRQAIIASLILAPPKALET